MCGTLYFHALRRAFKGQWSTASLYIHQTSSNICNNVNIEAGDFSKYTRPQCHCLCPQIDNHIQFHTCRPLRDVHVPLPPYFQITCKTLIDFFLNLIFRIRQSRMVATRCECTGSHFKMNLKFCYKCNVPACVRNPSG